MKNLKELYKNWREVTEELLEEGNKGSTDCGEENVRIDFSNYAELDRIISFEEMLELERTFEESK